MCVVSMVHDYYRDRMWPTQVPGLPTATFPPIEQWDSEAVQLLKRAVELLEALDKRLGDKECASPEKVAWLKKLSELLQEQPKQ